METSHLKLITLATIMNLLTFTFPVSAENTTNSLNTDDNLDNQYIENALAKQPNSLPEDSEYYAMLAALNAARAKAHSNQTEVIKKQSASNNIPEIQSVNNKSIEERNVLYSRLAEQTGLGIDEVRALFEGSTSQPIKQLDKPSE